jgi:tetratricopeptide (TPR) repeat protein
MGTENEKDELFDKAIRLEKLGEWEQAISLYEVAIDKWGDQPEAVYAKNCAACIREMQRISHQPLEQPRQSQIGPSYLMILWSHRGIRVSVFGALALVILDVGLEGSCLISLMVCPIWFLVSILKNAIQRPGWRLALLRIAIPVLTLGLILANAVYQFRISEANAARIITACEQFYVANGKYPNNLDELVPRYMLSIPPAKYCLGGKFLYMRGEESHRLLWRESPPYFRKIYHFETRQWSYMN